MERMDEVGSLDKEDVERYLTKNLNWRMYPFRKFCTPAVRWLALMDVVRYCGVKYRSAQC
jgi:hypothetical protein